jgi:N-acylneuraminate cytidylyltransferase
MGRKVIAFIPVRGGSKSIPLKNIKLFCGKPLVCWNIEALERVAKIDEIVIATDSMEIKETVEQYNYHKVKLYNRDEENAQDGASTESVIMEYLGKNTMDFDDVFMLVQATSPLTQTEDFQNALYLYDSGKYDSILSCVRTYRFFWNDDGSSKNYDYQNRPRRQDFSGTLMENGAFYINNFGNIMREKNRLSGKIGIYEMPEYTAMEIDEPDDWIILENLMKRHILAKKGLYKSKGIKVFLSDVDGVMTDGGMYYSEKGDELKKFNTRDGMALQILGEHGLKTGIVTSENTKIVETRAKKLKIDYVIQGKAFGGKLEAVKDMCNKEGFSLSEVAYVGDDINCLKLLSSVGYAFCPADACEEVKRIPNISICRKIGGDGVVREIIDGMKF